MTVRAHDYLLRVADLIDRVRDERFQIHDDTGLSIDRELGEAVSAVLEDAAGVLLDIQRHYDALLSDGEPAAPERETAVREVADLAFMSRSEMVGLREALQQSLEGKKVWKVLSYADAGLSRSQRALIAIESAIHELEGMAARERQHFDLQDALVIRRQYALLRRALLREGEPSGGDLQRALANMATHIAGLRNLGIYSLLRIDDRRQLRTLQKRIKKALDNSDDTEELEAERRNLWGDLVACSRLLMEVNNREELRIHDRQVVLDVYQAVCRRERDVATLPRRVLENLEPLLGRDPELDDMLLDPKTPSPELGLQRLRQLKRQLAPGEPSGEFPAPQ